MPDKNRSNPSQEINPNDWTVNDSCCAKWGEALTFSMVAIVRTVLEITSLAKLAGGWLMLSSASLLPVEVVDAVDDNHSCLHSVISLDLYRDLVTVNKCLFIQSIHPWNK